MSNFLFPHANDGRKGYQIVDDRQSRDFEQMAGEGNSLKWSPIKYQRKEPIGVKCTQR